MKIHESINTVIGVMGLVIASITAWSQFGPDPDELNIEISSAISSKIPFQPVMDFTDGVSDIEKEISGPVFWEVVAYNNLDRAVTVKEVSTHLLSEVNSGFISYSNLDVGVFNRKFQPLELPITIESRNAQVLILGLNIPVNKEQNTDETCYSSSNTLQDVEKCRYEKGYDLFGNAVDYREFDNPNGKNSFYVSWLDRNQAPQFITTFITGDGTSLDYRVNFYPVNK